jgi:uncharacterized membrane protein YbaN (DUF454 family)
MDAPDEQTPPPARSKVMRWALVALGTFFVALGVVGAFLPLLPTTPFLLLAAACYGRASPALHARLLQSPTFGPTLRAWRQDRRIPRRAKRVALAMIAVSFGMSAWVVPLVWVKALLGCLWAALSLWMWRLPEVEDRPSGP